MRPLTIFIMVGLLVSGCSTIKLPEIRLKSTPVSQQPAQRIDRQTVINEFERKIAEALLSDPPTLEPLASKEQTEAFLAKADPIVHRSDLDPRSLAPEQARTYKRLKDAIAVAEFRIPRWQQLNHLRDVQRLPVYPEAAEALENTLAAQVAVGAAYPQPLLDAAAQLLAQGEHMDINQAQLVKIQLAVSNLRSDARRWAQARLAFALTETDQQEALGRLRPRLAAQKQALQQIIDANALNLQQLYQDAYYDIRNEPDPPQIALDLLVINLQEALLALDSKIPVAIEGIEQDMLGLFHRQDANLDFNLTAFLSLPAFEYRAVAFEAASEVAGNNAWARPWRDSFALAVSVWLENAIEVNEDTAIETRVGSSVRHLLHLELAVAELELALGLANLTEIERRLEAHLPYTKDQLQQLKLSWLTDHRSSAVAMLIADDIDELPQAALAPLLNLIQPESYQAFKASLTR
ncbi:MAG: hypothetical protein ACE37D_15615 [Pseudomonadales bacterium]